MSIAFLAYRNMVSKPLNLMLSLLLLVLSISMVTFVLQLKNQADGQLNRNIAPFDMVLGAKGSPLQLVLSSVLHIDVPTGNVPLKEVGYLQKNPMVASAVPVSYGDNYAGYRILGTVPQYLKQYDAVIEKGKLYTEPFEVVVGYAVRSELGLELGDTFISSHGLTARNVESHDEHPYVVKGLLEPTGTVVDNLIITSLESIWEAHEHHETEEVHPESEHDHEHEHEDEREITSLLIKFRNPLGLVQFPRLINENTKFQAALPGYEIGRLTNMMGTGVRLINGISLVILVVSGLSIFISILRTVRERKQELALLRTYGFSTRQLLWLVILEGGYLAFFGFVLGWSLGRLGLFLASGFVQDAYGYVLKISGPDAVEWTLLAVTLVLAILATLLASISIFKLNVHKILSDV